jgi:hypothetical protein
MDVAGTLERPGSCSGSGAERGSRKINSAPCGHGAAAGTRLGRFRRGSVEMLPAASVTGTPPVGHERQ